MANQLLCRKWSKELVVKAKKKKKKKSRSGKETSGAGSGSLGFNALLPLDHEMKSMRWCFIPRICCRKIFHFNNICSSEKSEFAEC